MTHKNMFAFTYLHIEFVSQFIKIPLTKFITDTLVLNQRRVLESVPAVEDLCVVGKGGDSSQGQHYMVRQEGVWPLPKPRDDGAVPTVLGVTQYQNLLSLCIIT